MRKRTAAHPTGLTPATPAAGYWTAAHTLHRLRFHLVWVPKCQNTEDSKRVLNGLVAARLEALLRQACEVKTWGLNEISVQPDHVPVLLQIAPTDSVMSVMQSLKHAVLEGRDVARAAGRVPGAGGVPVILPLWGESFWSDGDFAESVGQAEEAVVRAYITPLKPPQPGPPGHSGPAPAQAEEAARLGPAPPPNRRTFKRELLAYRSC